MSDRQNKGSPQCPRQHRETHSLLVKAALHTKHNSWRKYTRHVTFTRLFRSKKTTLAANICKQLAQSWH